ncbi:hypothetical protein BKA62DRAFT_500982 [Auriculariales sp. MPI-PUGE-AT-0066]|nr:hypothetical protein BKA62DRAFT_500982 [Auriculariales sp. MPI-PUGE-AT-0066]
MSALDRTSVPSMVTVDLFEELIDILQSPAADTIRNLRLNWLQATDKYHDSVSLFVEIVRLFRHLDFLEFMFHGYGGDSELWRATQTSISSSMSAQFLTVLDLSIVDLTTSVNALLSTPNLETLILYGVGEAETEEPLPYRLPLHRLRKVIMLHTPSTPLLSLIIGSSIKTLRSVAVRAEHLHAISALEAHRNQNRITHIHFTGTGHVTFSCGSNAKTDCQYPREDRAANTTAVVRVLHACPHLRHLQLLSTDISGLSDMLQAVQIPLLSLMTSIYPCVHLPSGDAAILRAVLDGQQPSTSRLRILSPREHTNPLLKQACTRRRVALNRDIAMMSVIEQVDAFAKLVQ